MKAIFALLAFSFSTAASAACYIIYSQSNERIWQGSSPPVAMDTLYIDAEVQKKVPKGHMVILINSRAPCPEIDLTVPRKTMKDAAAEMNNR
ncbi:MAG: hypothetical protein AW10_01398 [Candidatus Accumulibacter appositus]|uniref:Uncharacterized protein n=1 Tax=Candidatus Accumulibacter appositus TaxID=1454003 RepID=A0A011PW42_9PROT|nr:hypothetical protein [Accumulibacter sp.]EXI81055.1 MAG: hypothetical protein AW10_01398 [Candidatus Accumulibacter appositus]HRF05713.1 hypothetical protein [Accumulibacter sp.]